MAKKKAKAYRKIKAGKIKKKKTTKRVMKKPHVASVRDSGKKDLMEFCKKCGSIMIPDKKGRTTYMMCRSCKYRTSKAVRDIKITEDVKVKDKIVVLEKDETLLPITDAVCPQCEHKKAYWWMQQTRESDEPPTQFFRCVKCQHVWREYK
jgi:DNA-directed RNA polymerase subunit M